MTALIVDVGSSSVRALLFDREGRLIPGAIARREHRFDADGTTDAVTLRGLVESCLDDVLRHPAARVIQTVGVATFAGNLLGVDQRGEPITPLYTYVDTRDLLDVRLLSSRIDRYAIHQRTGCPLHTAYQPVRLHWLRRTRPDLFARVARWIDFATYCYRIWFGHDVPCSYSVASWSGLLDRHRLVWDADWLEELGVAEESLPTLADFDTLQQGLSDTYSERWPALRDTPFYLAVGDGAAANIGNGGVDADHPVLTVGTTAAMRLVSDKPGEVPAGLWAYRVNEGLHLTGGATSEGGNIFAWARRTLLLDPGTVEQELLAREVGSHGLTALPLLAGERSPGYYVGAAGAIHSLRLDTTPLDILQALLEGVALRLRLIYDLMGRPGAFVLAGGGALERSLAWGQIVADVLGVPLRLADVPEATAHGVLYLQSGDLDAVRDRADSRPAHVVSPRPGSASRVSDLLDQHTRFYTMLRGPEE